MNVVWDKFLGIYHLIHVSVLKSIASVSFFFVSFLWGVSFSFFVAEPVLKRGTSGESQVVNSYLFVVFCIYGAPGLVIVLLCEMSSHLIDGHATGLGLHIVQVDRVGIVVLLILLV